MSVNTPDFEVLKTIERYYDLKASVSFRASVLCGIWSDWGCH